ncbi:GFA family protein [Baekduia soli]|uniref:GFA family protein n=1 Tax=Baekduia soli TaxID=496014 RepID=A0A5B8U5J8_9ACTN|nr:GFA family protein [Baekduia soli]QEC47922.1 GFA family protein [Baekduia soli]
MDTQPETLTGRCMCGAVTYSVTAEASQAVICHCVDCQRQTGTAFTAVVSVPADALEMEGDTMATYATTGTDHGQPTRRTFCSACGSPLVTHGAYPGLAFLKVGTLDDQSWIDVGVEIWCSSKPAWSPPFSGTQTAERDAAL